MKYEIEKIKKITEFSKINKGIELSINKLQYDANCYTKKKQIFEKKFGIFNDFFHQTFQFFGKNYGIFCIIILKTFFEMKNWGKNEAATR